MTTKKVPSQQQAHERFVSWTTRDTTWTQREALALNPSLPPTRGIGEPAAETCWAQQDKPWTLFVPIRTFEEFQPPEVLFLCGRRGTGKTELFRMLDHHIRSGKAKRYGLSAVVETKKINAILALQFRLGHVGQLTEMEMTFLLSKIWKWVVLVAGIAAAIRAAPEKRYPEDVAGGDDLETLRTYAPFVPSEWDPRRLSAAIENKLLSALGTILSAVRSATDVPSAAAALCDAFGGADFDRAERALSELLKRSQLKCLVMLDNAEEYLWRDPLYSAIVGSLLTTVNDVFQDSTRTNLSCKAAFPSELLPHMHFENQGKLLNRIVFVSWRYKDLVCLVAKRVAMLLLEHTPSAIGSLDDYAHARTFLLKYLPDTVQTRLRLRWDTLSYLVRHSQKTPRQVIELVNAILALAEENRVSLEQLRSNEKIVVDGIHSGLHRTVGDALDAYRQVYGRDVDVIVRRTLTGMPSYFGNGKLDERLKELRDVRLDFGMERVDLKRLLFETGALGSIHEIHSMSIDADRFVLEGEFEYQVKGVLVPGRQIHYVVHPMFTDVFEIFVDDNAYVYPTSFEAEEREILETAVASQA